MSKLARNIQDTNEKNCNKRCFVSLLIITQIAWTCFDLVALCKYGNIEYWPEMMLFVSFIVGVIFWFLWMVICAFGVRSRTARVISQQWVTLVCGFDFLAFFALKFFSKRESQIVYILLAVTFMRNLQLFAIIFSDAIKPLERFDKAILFLGILLYLIPEYIMTVFPKGDDIKLNIGNFSYFEVKRALILQILTVLVPSYYCLFTDRLGRKLLTVKEHVDRSMLSESIMRTSAASMTFSSNAMHYVTPGGTLGFEATMAENWKYASASVNGDAPQTPRSPEDNMPSPTPKNINSNFLYV